jgi:hypothetical protein
MFSPIAVLGFISFRVVAFHLHFDHRVPLPPKLSAMDDPTFS